MLNIKKTSYNLLMKLASFLKEKEQNNIKEIPFNHKIKTRKLLQPHINKRIDRGNIADPFGSFLSILDNLVVSIDIINYKFKFKDEERMRRVDQIKKDLNMIKRKFSIMISDKFAEKTYGKELTSEEELVTIYRIFDGLYNHDISKERDIYLEEWAYDIRFVVDKSFKELLEITAQEGIPARDILFHSMQPDVKIKIVRNNFGQNHIDESKDYGDDELPY